MDKYIYILVGIVWVVSNIYKSFKRKESEAKSFDPESRKPKEEGRSIETILEEMISGKTQGEPVTTREQRSVPSDYPVNKSTSEYSQELIDEETPLEVKGNNLFSYETPTVELKDNKGEVSINSKSEEEIAAFDLRNAIIYSEIIGKPKYLSDL